jgi:hypothetical protein
VLLHGALFAERRALIGELANAVGVGGRVLGLPRARLVRLIKKEEIRDMSR